MRVLNKQIPLSAIGNIAAILAAMSVAGCSFDKLSIEKGRLDPNGLPLRSGTFVDSSTNKTLRVSAKSE
jgi:hypothetical protein